jgi:hypothetical protein
MSTYLIYSGERLLGRVRADSEIHAAWVAWKRWPSHGRIRVECAA